MNIAFDGSGAQSERLSSNLSKTEGGTEIVGWLIFWGFAWQLHLHLQLQLHFDARSKDSFFGAMSLTIESPIFMHTYELVSFSFWVKNNLRGFDIEKLPNP